MRWFRQSAHLDSTAANEQQQQWTELPPSQQQQSNDSSRFAISTDSANLLLIKALQPQDNRSRFRCLANNTFGVHQAETELRLDIWPPARLVELEPANEFVNNGELAERQYLVFNCTIRASSQPLVAVEWLRNGRLLFSLSLPQFSATSNSIVQADGQHQAAFATNMSSPVSSLLDDPNQQLQAIEHYKETALPSGGSSDTHEQQQQLLYDSYEAYESSSATMDGGQSADSQQQQSDFIVSSTSLSKLAGEFDGGERPFEAPKGDRHNSGDHRRRLRQRAKLIAPSLSRNDNNPALLYQLHLDQVRRSDRGSYQCRARTLRTTLHASSHLMLKDNPPQFVSTFASQLISQSVAVGSSSSSGSKLLSAASSPSSSSNHISLKCVASGSPLPEISWTLSGFPVPESSRFRVGDYVTRDGLIVSFVNITNVQPEGE